MMLQLQEGFDLLARPQSERTGVHRPPGFRLFSSLHPAPIRCHFCECEADGWNLTKDRRHGGRILNLFAGDRMMTRDHIVPVSLGGVDDVANLRPACAPCNSSRGNTLSEADIKVWFDRQDLVDPERLARGYQSMTNQVRQLEEGIASRLRQIEQAKRAITKLRRPYQDIGYPPQ
jgi:hypothetical protein